MKKSIWLSVMVAVFGLSGMTAAAQVQDPAAAQVAVQMQSAMVNINQADAQTLARELQGIGMAKAQAIVDYRNARGDFATVDELLEVKGIGVATLERNRSRLTLE